MFPFADINPTVRTPIVTVAIILLNVAAMVYVSRLSPPARETFVVEHGFVPKRIQQLRNPHVAVVVTMERLVQAPQPFQPRIQPTVYVLPPDPRAIYASILTTMFLHGGWLHLLGNMWFFWIFGDNIEDRLGHVLFLVFYFAGGLIATGCYWAFDPAGTVPVIGASGAVAAVLGAYAVTFPFARVRTLIFLLFFITIVELPALVVLGFWFLTQLVEAVGITRVGVTGGNGEVAWWAHVGGFLSGMALMPLISGRPPPPETHPDEEGLDEWRYPTG